MWKSSSSGRPEDEKRPRDPKISHMNKYSYKSSESGPRDDDFSDNYSRRDGRSGGSRQKLYPRDQPRDQRHTEKRYVSMSSTDDRPQAKYQKRRHSYGIFDAHSDRNFEEPPHSSRKSSDKYKSNSQRRDYKPSKRHHSPGSPRAPYSPYKPYERTNSHRGYDRGMRNSPSPKTPASDDGAMRNKFSPPPLPPFEPPMSTQTIGHPVAKRVPKSDRPEPVSTFAQFYENKRHDGKYKDYGPDPRLNEHLYGSRVLTKFDLVTFPPNPNIDTTLDSPTFSLEVKYHSIYSFNTFFQTPLERINHFLFSSRPKIDEEWWLKGTLSLLLIGIPRNWGATEVLSHLVGTHNMIMSSRETLSDEWKSDSDSEELNLVRLRKTLKADCTKLGITKFILLFGDSSVAINDVPLMYPRNPEVPETGDEAEEVRKRFIANDQPDGMGLLLFDSEDRALKFWSIMASSLVQAYPSTMRLCPDPSGWRIYSEALSLTFNNDMLTSSAPPVSPPNDTIDLLSVLTSPNANFTQTSSANSNPVYNPVRTVESPGNKTELKNPKNTLTFVCSYISDQEEANAVARNLIKFGIKCMYHKHSKIMSIQFPDEKALQSISFGHKVFTTPSGTRVQCCFIRCQGKAIPILKRANVEHISNSYEKKKNLPPKQFKFSHPASAVVSVEDLNE